MMKLLDFPVVKECEVLALLKAISWVCTLGYNNVFLETDLQMVMNALAYGSCDNTRFGVFMSSCHLSLYSEFDFNVVFV